MRRPTSLLALVLTGISAVVLVPEIRAETPTPWVAEPTWLGGTTTIVDGELVHTDFVYDDYGADTGAAGQTQVVSLASTSGDVRYPDGADYLDNAADIVEVRARLQGDDLRLRILLNTLTAASAIRLGVALGDITSPLTPWPGVGVASRHDRFESFSADDFAAVDLDANTVELVLDDIGTTGIRTLNVGVGLDDGAGGFLAPVAASDRLQPDSLTSGAPTEARLLDLAFNHRSIEPRSGAWQEDAQSDALHAGDISPYVVGVDLDLLAADGSVAFALEPGGFYNRIFRSRQTHLGEGMAPSFPQYRGPYQPYGLWLPPGYDVSGATPTPLLLSLHSLSVHHNQYRGGSLGSSYPTYYEQMGNGDRDVDGVRDEGFEEAIVVTPLGRGPDGWYTDEGLIDTLEVWADAVAHYAVDPERTSVTGYSMGGYGTYRLATLMPDAFASAAVFVGPPANGIWAWPVPPGFDGEDVPHNTYFQLENTEHIPFWITQGAEDELVPVAGVTHQAERFRELGHEYRYSLHPVSDHLSFVFTDDWTREAGWLNEHRTRIANPAHVELRVRPESWASAGPDRSTLLGHLSALLDELSTQVDGAYWVHDVVVDRAEEEDVTGVVDLVAGTGGERIAGGADVAGAGVAGTPYVLTGFDPDGVAVASDDRVVGSLTGISALTIDLVAAGLTDHATWDIDVDREVTLTLLTTTGTAVVVLEPGI